MKLTVLLFSASSWGRKLTNRSIICDPGRGLELHMGQHGREMTGHEMPCQLEKILEAARAGLVLHRDDSRNNKGLVWGHWILLSLI
jgi:hypothetical protein